MAAFLALLKSFSSCPKVQPTGGNTSANVDFLYESCSEMLSKRSIQFNSIYFLLKSQHNKIMDQQDNNEQTSRGRTTISH